MFSFLLINTVFLLQIVARLFGVLKRAVNVRFVRNETCASAVPPPPVVRPPSAPAQESGTSVRKKTSCSNDETCATVKKKARRSDLNGPTDQADTPKNKPADPDKPSVSARAPSAASGKPKATFGGMKAGFLLQSPKKKPQPKTESAAKADTPKAVKAPSDQSLKNTAASAGQKDPTTEAGHPKPRQKKEAPKTPSAGGKSGQKQAQSPRPTTESGQTPRQSSSAETIPIIPVLAHVRPILLPVPGTNQASLIWDGSRKARNFLAMIIAARRAAGL